jgi:hypothetical protein
MDAGTRFPHAPRSHPPRGRESRPPGREEGGGAPPASSPRGAAAPGQQAASEALDDLRFHWSEAYEITASRGTWQAAPKADPAAVLTAATAADLRKAIRADYGTRAARAGLR